MHLATDMALNIDIKSLTCNVIPEILIPVKDFLMHAIGTFTYTAPGSTTDSSAFHLQLVCAVSRVELCLFETCTTQSRKLLMRTGLLCSYEMKTSPENSFQRIELVADGVHILRDYQTDSDQPIPESSMVLPPQTVCCNYNTCPQRGSLSVAMGPVNIALSYQVKRASS